MIAADSSSLIAFIQGDTGKDVEALDASLAAGRLVISPVVLCELLSDPTLPAKHAGLVRGLPTFQLQDGFWIRAAQSRALLIAKGLRARLPDALIAQSCIDHEVALIERDGDFRHFAKHCGLKLA